MKCLLRITLAISFIILVLLSSACDIISEDERYLLAEKIEMKKVVLLEDFTGQRCVNCPEATTEAKLLLDVYKDHLIVVAVHAGGFALPILSTTAGEEYNTYFGVDQYPAGIIDRKVYKNKLFRPEYSTWGEAVKNNVWRESGIDIQTEKVFHSGDKTLSIKTKMKRKENIVLPENLYLQIWLIESGLKAIQYMPDGSRNREYVHNNVFREAVNGTWGQILDFKSKNEVSLGIDKYLLQNVTVPENAEIVLFIYNKSNSEIMDAKKISLTK